MENKDLQEVREGLAKVSLPKNVFYNPVQEYNRDLTVAVISEYSCENSTEPKEAGVKDENGIRIFEGLAASGLRSVRFGLEVPGVKEIVANDFDQTAVSIIEDNIKSNDLESIMKSRCGDAAMGMYESKDKDKQFDVIDLDPYGTPSMFIDSCVQAVKDGGLLCITCTDAAVLCGNTPEKCYAIYGATPLRSKCCHEMSLRIILQFLDSCANKYSRYIEPLLSLSIDFYFRVFVKVHQSPKLVKESILKKSYVYECTGCGTFSLQPIADSVLSKNGNVKFVPATAPVVNNDCIHCGHRHKIGGPIWSAPLHKKDFVEKVLLRVDGKHQTFATRNRIVGMLSLVLEELHDVPLYYVLDSICKTLRCALPPMTVLRSALLNAGHRVSSSHAKKNSYKTDAPAQVLWDIMRAWVKENPVSEKNQSSRESVSRRILDKPSQTEASFSLHPEANPQSRQKGLVRWQINPQPNWGPKSKASRSKNADILQKKVTNQGKKRKCEEPTLHENVCPEDN